MFLFCDKKSTTKASKTVLFWRKELPFVVKETIMVTKKKGMFFCEYSK